MSESGSGPRSDQPTADGASWPRGYATPAAGDRAASAPSVVAVVLNWCGEEMAADCVRSLQASDYPALEILLVDNGSPDGSGEELRRRFPKVPFIQTGRNLGYTGGNNLGIEWALDRDADWVLILNHDTTVEPGAIRRMAASAEEWEDRGDAPDPGDAARPRGPRGPGRVRVAGISPTIVHYDAPLNTWYGGGEFSRLRGLGLHWRVGADPGVNGRPAPEEVTFLSGCACMLRAEALRAVGAFAPDYFAYVEDAELSVRLRRAGWTLLHEPRARVRHRKPVDPVDPPPFAITLRDRNRRRLMRRHFGPLERAPFLVWFWTTRLVRMAQYALKGDFERARAIVEGMAGR